MFGPTPYEYEYEYGTDCYILGKSYSTVLVLVLVQHVERKHIRIIHLYEYALLVRVRVLL